MVTTQFAACALTGQEADLDGVCVEHGETACVMTLEGATPMCEWVIPGSQCTHRDDMRRSRIQPA